LFENIIDQGAVLQLRDDIVNRRNAPSMLFFGPAASGKSSAALELARVLSCEQSGEWKCACVSCERHRYLQHDDLLILGNRSFSAEIEAGKAAFLRNPSSQGARFLFFRSLRKLIIRFSPVIMEDDPKLSKITSVLQSLDEKLGEFLSIAQVNENDALKKICDALVKDANNLENEGISKIIPIGHIRKASGWARLSPAGKRKTLIIENAENMRDEGRNSLLKLLEEPPASISIVLTAQRREAIMPTILSRLRPYRFLKRSAESEKEVIRRIFMDSVNGKSYEFNENLIGSYLDSFLPGKNSEKLLPLAAWFIVSMMQNISMSVIKNEADSFFAFLNILTGRYAQIAEKSGLMQSEKGSNIIKTLVSKGGGFKDDSFSLFMKICLEITGDITRTSGEPQFILYNDIFKKYINEAVTAVEILNINAVIALEGLFFNIKKSVKRGFNG